MKIFLKTPSIIIALILLLSSCSSPEHKSFSEQDKCLNEKPKEGEIHLCEKIY